MNRQARFLSALLLITSACTRPPDASAPLAAQATRSQTSMATSTPGQMPCTVFHVPSTPEVLAAEFESRAHVTGSETAPVTIVSFSAYDCPACAYQAAILKQIRLLHADELRFIFLPILRTGSEMDLQAVRLVEAAALQEGFWEMHDLLFASYLEWAELDAQAFEQWAIQRAGEIGLDSARLGADLAGAEVQQRLTQALAVSAGMQSYPLPLLYINSNSPYEGLADLASLDAVIRLESLTARMFSRCPDWVIDPTRQYIAILETSRGQVVIQLFPDKAPLAVNNFVFLAQQGWFDDLTWHRVLSGSLAASGDPSGTGYGNPGYYFEVEMPPGLSFDRPGMLAMDNRGIGTNGSQFFISLAPNSQLNGGYTILGQVLDGMDVLAALAPRLPQPGIYLPPGDDLIRVSIEVH